MNKKREPIPSMFVDEIIKDGVRHETISKGHIMYLTPDETYLFCGLHKKAAAIYVPSICGFEYGYYVDVKRLDSDSESGHLSLLEDGWRFVPGINFLHMLGQRLSRRNRGKSLIRQDDVRHLVHAGYVGLEDVVGLRLRAKRLASVRQIVA